MSVTSESITKSIGYPLCEACPEKKRVDMGTDRLGMRIAVDWDIKPQIMQKPTAYSLASMITHTHARSLCLLQCVLVNQFLLTRA